MKLHYKSFDMKNTDYSSTGIRNLISSESSFDALLDIISELDLEILSVSSEGQA